MKKLRVEEEVSPNLIPMIDIMFLLLLFFMLGSDMAQRELEDVVLPKSKTAGLDPGIDRLTVNVHHEPRVTCGDRSQGRRCFEERHWRLGIRGEDVTATARLEDVLRREAVAERHVMIRADGGSPYGLAQRVMHACAKSGLYKIQVGASKAGS